jgi:uncharacterized metal-binding protein
MPQLPNKKVGIVACSGEEMPEGTVTRLAALKVLEHLRPQQTVTICLPLFLAGGEGDRAFARFYPTIAVDGCEKRCAARGTEKYSGKPAVSLVVSEDFSGDSGQLGSARRLNSTGKQVAELLAARIAGGVDRLLGIQWDRHSGQAVADPEPASEPESGSKVATCSCGSGIPIQKLAIGGVEVTLIALPLIFARFREAGKLPGPEIADELMQTVKIYNPIPDSEQDAYAEAILKEFKLFCQENI